MEEKKKKISQQMQNKKVKLTAHLLFMFSVVLFISTSWYRLQFENLFLGLWLESGFLGFLQFSELSSGFFLIRRTIFRFFPDPEKSFQDFSRSGGNFSGFFRIRRTFSAFWLRSRSRANRNYNDNSYQTRIQLGPERFLIPAVINVH